jgi:hypothetical protein
VLVSVEQWADLLPTRQARLRATGLDWVLLAGLTPLQPAGLPAERGFGPGDQLRRRSTTLASAHYQPGPARRASGIFRPDWHAAFRVDLSNMPYRSSRPYADPYTVQLCDIDGPEHQARRPGFVPIGFGAVGGQVNHWPPTRGSNAVLAIGARTVLQAI